MALTKVVGELIDIGDLDLSDVGTISLDAIQGDADANTSITFSGSDVITIATGGSGRLTIGDGALSPVTNNQIDLGTASLEFKNAFFDGTVTADAFAGPLTGNVTGNASGTALTVTQAAQTAITSVGTLTSLTVDDITINASTISDGGALTLTSGDDLTLDAVGDIHLDADGADITFKDAGSIKMLLKDEKLIIGHTASITGVAAMKLQVNATDSTGSIQLGRWTNNNLGSYLSFVKSRNATIGSNTVVQDGDSLGQITWSGDDGSDWGMRAAGIFGRVDGTPGSDDMPGRIEFITTPDGAAFGVDNIRMVIKSDGKVGIGTTTANKIVNFADPDQGGETLKLHFEAATAQDKWAIYAYDRTNGHYANMSLGQNAVFINGSDANVGIGVTPETDWHADWHGFQVGEGTLGVLKTGAQISLAQNARGTAGSSNSSWKYIKALAATQYVQSGGDHYWKSAASGSADAGITWTQAMTLTSAGKLYIGATSPALAGTLSVEASNAGVPVGWFKNTNGDSVGIRSQVNSNAAGNYIYYAVNSGGGVWQIRNDGDHQGTDTSIGQLSDSRLKKDVSGLTYDIDKFKQYRPIEFNWINPELHKSVSGKSRGFLAQEVKALDDYYVDQYEAEGNDLSLVDADKKAYSTKFGYKDAMYISVIKQLITRLETAEAKIAVLEG